MPWDSASGGIFESITKKAGQKGELPGKSKREIYPYRRGATKKKKDFKEKRTKKFARVGGQQGMSQQ